MRKLLLYFDNRQQAESFTSNHALDLKFQHEKSTHFSRVNFTDMSDLDLQVLVMQYGYFKQNEGSKMQRRHNERIYKVTN